MYRSLNNRKQELGDRQPVYKGIFQSLDILSIQKMQYARKISLHMKEI